jgi:hypothetical protein
MLVDEKKRDGVAVLTGSRTINSFALDFHRTMDFFPPPISNHFNALPLAPVPAPATLYLHLPSRHANIHDGTAFYVFILFCYLPPTTRKRKCLIDPDLRSTSGRMLHESRSMVST